MLKSPYQCDNQIKGDIKVWLIIIWSSTAANQSPSIHKRRGSHLYVTLRGIYTLKVFTQPLTRNILSTELVTEGKELNILLGRILQIGH